MRAGGPPPHLIPILDPVRSVTALITIWPRTRIPEPPAARGWVAIVCDDALICHGPEGYDGRLVRLAGQATAVAIFSGAPVAEYYALAVAPALTGGRIIIIETQIHHNTARAEYARRHARGAPQLQVIPRGGTA